MSGSYVFLVVTVGGNHASLVTTLLHWRPSRVCFVTAEEADAGQGEAVLAAAQGLGVALEPGQWDLVALPHVDDLHACIARLRPLASEVEEWLARGEQYQVAVDFTAGTKCMAAALALHARRWPCAFSYVVTTDGLNGPTERIVQRYNPWDALGYQAIEDACELFNRGHCAAAAEVLKSARYRAEGPAVKRELSTLEALTRAYAAWDRFDHGGASSGLADVLKNANDLRVILGPGDGDRLVEVLAAHRALLEDRLADPIADLVANAMRRAREGRYDDAVARLYRAVEALAQMALRSHGLEAARIALADLPQALRSEWGGRPCLDGTLAIGLQDAYRLLLELDDPLGSRYAATALGGTTSPLTARNQSILAHGFQPVGDAVYRRLLNATLELSGLAERELPMFPMLELLPVPAGKA